MELLKKISKIIQNANKLYLRKEEKKIIFIKKYAINFLNLLHIFYRKRIINKEQEKMEKYK